MFGISSADSSCGVVKNSKEEEHRDTKAERDPRDLRGGGEDIYIYIERERVPRLETADFSSDSFYEPPSYYC